MEQKEIVLKMMEDSGKSRYWLAKQLGYANAAAFYNMLNRGSFTVETFSKICAVFGYNIMVTSSKPMNDGYFITLNDDK